jgi:integrase
VGTPGKTLVTGEVDGLSRRQDNIAVDTKKKKLPRGLQWREGSPHIYFSWRDSRMTQHRECTGTSDPAQALIYKLQFLEHQREDPDLLEVAEKTENRGKLPLKEVAEKYFALKLADNAAGTVARERRMFKRVLRFFGPNLPIRRVNLGMIEEYQKMRRVEISPTMRKPVSARTVNYEMQLLRGAMTYADCWTDTLEARYKPLRQAKPKVGKAAGKERLKHLLATAKTRRIFEVAMYAAAVAAGTGCRGCEIRNLQIGDIQLEQGIIVVRAEIAKNRQEREPQLMALAAWGLRNLLERAKRLGATAPSHYLLPLNIRKSNLLVKDTDQKWDVTRPMVTWVKAWRRLTAQCNMKGFRFHDLRHTFRTLGAEAGVPLEVMMAQLGHMDRETSLEYVHIQQRALQRAKTLIEAELVEVLATAEALTPANNPAASVSVQ